MKTTKKKYLFVKSLILWVLSILCGSPCFGQQQVIVSNSPYNQGKEIIIRWFTEEIIIHSGVNLFRSDDNGISWQPLTESSLQLGDNILKDKDFIVDSSLQSYVDLANAFLNGNTNPFLKIPILIKAVFSSVYAEYIGMQYIDKTVTEGNKYIYKVSFKDRKNSEYSLKSKPIYAGNYIKNNPPKGGLLNQDNYSTLIKWLPELDRYFAVNIFRVDSIGIYQKINSYPVLISSINDENGKEKHPEYYYKDSNMVKGNAYYYSLQAIDYFGFTSDFSDTIGIFIRDLKKPSVPIAGQSEISANELLINWSFPKDEVVLGFKMYFSSDDSVYSVLDTIISTENRIYYSEIPEPGPLYYKISAIGINSNESVSRPHFIEIPDLTPPNPPENIRIMADTGKIHLFWNSNEESDLMGYVPYRFLKPDSEKIRMVKEPLKTTFFTDSIPALSQNTFYYSIVAIDKSFNYSGYSQTVAARMPDILPPSRPVLRISETRQDTVVLKWTKIKDKDLTGYKLFRKDSCEFINLNKKLISNDTETYYDTKVLPSILYSYYLIAEDSCGNTSLPSKTVIVNISRDKKSPVIQRFSLKHNKRKSEINFEWKASGNIIGYVIFCRKEGNISAFPVTGRITDNKFCFKKEKAEKSYYFLTCYSRDGLEARSNEILVE